MRESVSRDAWASSTGQDPRAGLVHLLRSITVELDLLAAAFASANQLHPTDLRALIHLLDAVRDGTAATPGWLGARMGMPSAATTALLDRLEGRGYVRRAREDADRRRVRLVVDEPAIDLGWSFFGALITRMLGAMDDFDAAELATVRRFLTKMHAAIADADEDRQR